MINTFVCVFILLAIMLAILVFSACRYDCSGTSKEEREVNGAWWLRLNRQAYAVSFWLGWSLIPAFIISAI